MQPRLNKIFLCGICLAAAYLFYTYAAGGTNFFTRHIQYQRSLARGKIGTTELNSLLPSFTHLAAFALGKEPFNPDAWQGYQAYFGKVAELMPQRWDGQLFLGYVDYYSGQKASAARAFEEAIRLNPQVFWPYYNLSIMAAQDGNCQGAAALAKAAVDVPVQETVKSMYSSKLYIDVRSAVADFDASMEGRMKAAYMDMYRLGALAAACDPQLPARAAAAQIQVF